MTTWKILGALPMAASLVFVTTAALAQTTVTMWSFLDPNKTSPREKALRQIIANFEEKNPNIKIKVEPQDFAAMSLKFFLGHQQGNNPDVVWINTINLGALAKSESGADLNPLVVSKWPKEEVDDFYIRSGFTGVQRNGKQIALPINHGASVIYYRKDLLQKAGIDPASLKTWDSIREAAKKLTVTDKASGRTEVWGFGMPLSPEKTESSPLVISLMDQKPPAFDGCKPNFATPDSIRSLSYIKSLIMDDKVTPRDALTYTTDDVTEQFAAGRYAMVIAASLRYSNIRGAATFNKDDFGIIPWPTWSGDHAGPMPVSGWWIVVWAKSPRQAEAAKFAEHLVNRESVALFTSVGGQVPIRKSALNDPTIAANPEFAWMRTMVDAWAASSWMEPTDCNTQRFQPSLNEAVHRVIAGTDAKRALEEAEAKFQELQ